MAILVGVNQYWFLALHTILRSESSNEIHPRFHSTMPDWNTEAGFVWIFLLVCVHVPSTLDAARGCIKESHLSKAQVWWPSGTSLWEGPHPQLCLERKGTKAACRSPSTWGPAYPPFTAHTSVTHILVCGRWGAESDSVCHLPSQLALSWALNMRPVWWESYLKTTTASYGRWKITARLWRLPWVCSWYSSSMWWDKSTPGSPWHLHLSPQSTLPPTPLLPPKGGVLSSFRMK